MFKGKNEEGNMAARRCILPCGFGNMTFELGHLNTWFLTIEKPSMHQSQ